MQEHAEVIHQIIDSARLLHLPQNSPFSELTTNVTANSFDSIFNDLNNGSLNGKYKEELYYILNTTVGNDFRVYNIYSSSDFNIIRTFSEFLITKLIIYRGGVHYIQDNYGNIKALAVDYSYSSEGIKDSTVTNNLNFPLQRL
jgi:hypothetical protein